MGLSWPKFISIFKNLSVFSSVSPSKMLSTPVSYTHLDGFLHPLGRVALGKILPQDVSRKGYFVEIAFLFLAHDDAHHIKGQMSLLAASLLKSLKSIYTL